MDNVIVKSIGKETEVEISPFRMFIKFDEENLELSFEGASNNRIRIKGDTQFLFDGNTHFISTGEFGIITKGKDICLDSMDANIHLNSRLATPIKDLPESIAKRNEYGLKQHQISEKIESHAIIKEKEKKDFDLYLESLETKIYNLEKVCSELKIKLEKLRDVNC